MSNPSFNKFRAALHVLQRGREILADELADTVLDRAEDLVDSPYLFNELLEVQGSKLHFLGLLMAHLEQSAEEHDAAEASASGPPADEAETSDFLYDEDKAAPARTRKRARRRKKLDHQPSPEGPTGERERGGMGDD
jgi:hypothetical protein